MRVQQRVTCLQYCLHWLLSFSCRSFVFLTEGSIESHAHFQRHNDPHQTFSRFLCCSFLSSAAVSYNQSINQCIDPPNTTTTTYTGPTYDTSYIQASVRRNSFQSVHITRRKTWKNTLVCISSLLVVTVQLQLSLDHNMFQGMSSTNSTAVISHTVCVSCVQCVQLQPADKQQLVWGGG